MYSDRNSYGKNSSNHHIYKTVSKGSSSPQCLDKTEIISSRIYAIMQLIVIKTIYILSFFEFCETALIRIPGFVGQKPVVIPINCEFNCV